jgi:hypothetical protein
MTPEQQQSYIDGRWAQLSALTKDVSDRAAAYLLLTNSGGAVATLSFIGAVESIRSQYAPRIALALFALGLILVGVYTAMRVHYVDRLLPIGVEELAASTEVRLIGTRLRARTTNARMIYLALRGRLCLVRLLYRGNRGRSALFVAILAAHSARVSKDKFCLLKFSERRAGAKGTWRGYVMD